MRLHWQFGIVVAAVLATGPAAALPKGFKAKADALLAASFRADGPGVSVAIGEKGKIVYEGQRGLAGVAAKRPITSGTMFRLGSITKQFAAAVVLQLAAEDQLCLGDPLSKFLPDYPNGDAITVRELLNHTSGVQSYTDIPGWMSDVANTGTPHTTQELIAVFKDRTPNFAPGTKYSYNNSGYVLVAAVIEAVTKRHWYEEVRSRISGPLKLPSIGYGVGAERLRMMAAGYTKPKAIFEMPLAQKIDMSVPSAAGGLVGSAADVTRWGYALHHDQVVHAPYYAQMIGPSSLTNGKPIDYGYGLGSGKIGKLTSIGHSGHIFGFASDSAYLPKYDVFITVLVNSDSPQTEPGALLATLAGLATTYTLKDAFPLKRR